MRFRFRRKKYLLIIMVSTIVVLSLGVYLTNHYNKNKPLTSEEKIEDFEYLYSFISDNYPYLKVNERVNGVNWLDEENNFRTIIENTNQDYEFIYEVGGILDRLNDLHTHVISDEMYPSFYKIYSELPEESGYKPWVDVLEDEIVTKRYELDEQSVEVFQHQLNHLQNSPACKTDILLPDEVAYLKINQMENERIEKDAAIIRNFFEEIKDYEKLIIDIRGNGGGNDLYWENIIPSLANETLTAENYILARDDYSKYFYESIGHNFSPISELDESTLSILPEEIVSDFKYYDISTRTIEPDNSVGFNGKIYLLVDKNVYSSADTFASFSKESGLTTLVGETTAGGGNGLGPLFFSLPNSGIVVRFSGALVLNNDGTIHEETGTIPDIEINATIGPNYSNDYAIQYIINDL